MVWLTCFNQGGGFRDVRRSVDLPCPSIQARGARVSSLGQYFLESDDGPIPNEEGAMCVGYSVPMASGTRTRSGRA